VIDLTAFSELAGGLDHPEGVAFGPDGRVYAGGEAGQVYRISLEGDVEELAATGGFMYGVTLDGDANVYGCDFGRAAVVRISPAGTIETYSTGTDARPMRVPNFSAFDDDGNLYVTDSGDWGSDDGVIFRIAPGGGTSVWAESIPRFPNGCCLSRDGSHLLVIESRGRRVWMVPIRDDGSAGPPEPIVELPGSQPDGIALASEGTMFVGCYRPDRIYRIRPDGASEILAEDPDGVVLNQPTNVAFVGPELGRLVVSSLGGWSLLIAEVGAAGLALRAPKL
jgi:gluconolactonase